MDDKRRLIIECSLAELREDGFATFSQTKVAKRAGLRQSHLTYYYPTKDDLLVAVAEAGMEQQLTALDGLLAGTPKGRAPAQIALLLGRKENARVLLALVQGADRVPRLQVMFTDFSKQMRERAAALLASGENHKVPARDAYLLHALCVGLAVLGLALDDADGGDARKVAAIEAAARMLRKTTR
jgi:AcrR family transcriptional regulator